MPVFPHGSKFGGSTKGNEGVVVIIFRKELLCSVHRDENALRQGFDFLVSHWRLGITRSSGL
jgi:hypothetical protein